MSEFLQVYSKLPLNVDSVRDDYLFVGLGAEQKQFSQ